MVEDNHIRVVSLDGNADFLGLALPDEQPCLGRIAGSRYRRDRDSTGRAHEFREFLQILLAGAFGKVHMDQNGPFTAFRAFEQTDTPSSGFRNQAFPGSLPP